MNDQPSVVRQIMQNIWASGSKSVMAGVAPVKRNKVLYLYCMVAGTVVGLGEVLWDLLPGQKMLGGAPANFAYYVSKFGFRGVVVSAVGKDLLGREILDALAEKELEFMIEEVDFPTGTVRVHLDGNGIPQYEICEGVAWDNIPFTKRAEVLARNCNAVCFGSLAQRCETSRATIYRFLELVPDDSYKIFDVNLRQHFYTKDIIDRSLRCCNVLKVNDEELWELAGLFGLAGLSEREICLHFLKAYGLRIVMETKGANGSYVFTAAVSSFLDSPKVVVADTVGAGDSFTGAFVAALLRGDSIGCAHEFAVKISSHVCSLYGAMNF